MVHAELTRMRLDKILIYIREINTSFKLKANTVIIASEFTFPKQMQSQDLGRKLLKREPG